MKTTREIDWCRDERCSIEALHPAHEVKVSRGRPPHGMERTPPERREHNRKKFELLRQIHGNRKIDSMCPSCQGRGWVEDWTSGCATCLGRGRLSWGTRALLDRISP